MLPDARCILTHVLWIHVLKVIAWPQLVWLCYTCQLLWHMCTPTNTRPTYSETCLNGFNTCVFTHVETHVTHDPQWKMFSPVEQRKVGDASTSCSYIGIPVTKHDLVLLWTRSLYQRRWCSAAGKIAAVMAESNRSLRLVGLWLRAHAACALTGAIRSLWSVDYKNT